MSRMHETARRMIVTCLLIPVVGLLPGGCASTPGGSQQVARYYPDVQDRNPVEWQRLLAEKAAVSAPVDDAETLVETVETNAQAVAETTTPDSATNDAVVVAATNAATNMDEKVETEMGVESSGGPASLKPLVRGGKVTIYLTGTRNPQELTDHIDGDGNINLPHIGAVKIADLKATEAEDLIQLRYIEGGYFKKITVIIVPELGEFFVQGEVQMPGKYLMTSEMTLLRAIAEARGYTDFANPRKITVRRGDEVHEFNARKIEDLKVDDPIIRSGDVIIVPRKWIW